MLAVNLAGLDHVTLVTVQIAPQIVDFVPECTSAGQGTSASPSVLTATASITLFGGGTVDCYYTDYMPSSQLTVQKTSTTTAVTTTGQLVPYTYTVTNTGNTTVNSIVVADNNVDASGVSCPQTSLAANKSMTCTAQRTITQQDMDTGGTLTNIVTVTSSAPTVTDTLSIPTNQTAALTLTKTASPTTYSKAGDTISYSYVLMNSGNVTLYGPFTVADDKTSVNCPSTPASLAVCHLSSERWCAWLGLL